MSIVAITGVSGYIGTRLLHQLEDDPEVQKIVGIDVKTPQGDFNKLEFHRLDVRDPRIFELLKSKKVKEVIHLAFIVNPLHDDALMHDIDVRGSKNVLDATAACEAEHLIVASSTSAFGAFPDNPEFLTENDPPRRQPNYTYASDKYEVEKLIERFKEENPNIGVAVVRPCIVYGPNVDNYLSRFLLRLPFLPTTAKAMPEMQFVHEDDVATVFRKIYDQKKVGFFHAIGEGVIGVEEISKLLGKRIINFPEKLIYPAIDILWKLHAPLIEGPSGMIDFIRYRWVASDHLTREALNHQPQYSSREVVEIMIKTHKKR